MKPILFVRCDAFETYGVAPSAVEAVGATIRIWDAIDPAEDRPNLADVSGVVLFGSTSNVEHADERPFIKQVADLTQETIERGVPFLGLCFGAQVLAWALGDGLAETRKQGTGNGDQNPVPTSAHYALRITHYALASIFLLASVLLIGRATGGDYDLERLPVPALAEWPLALLLVAVGLWMGFAPFTGRGLRGSTRAR